MNRSHSLPCEILFWSHSPNNRLQAFVYLPFISKSGLQMTVATTRPAIVPVQTTHDAAAPAASTLLPSAWPPPTQSSPTPPQPIPPSTTPPTYARCSGPRPKCISFAHSLHSSCCCVSFASSVSLSAFASMAPPCP